MCGIFGAVHSRKDQVHTEAILKTIAHRGPDDKDIYQASNVLFGHVRLSIQDLTTRGHQPMHSTDGSYTIIFNGEIYNHWEIREDLIKKGYSFISTSDTETLLYAYVEYGKECLQQLNGIFSFAIHDKKQNKVFIARDHLGVKPLYYYHDKDLLLFSSELKALLHVDKADYSLQPEAFYQYLLLLWSPGAPTPFQKINKLLPGHYIELDPNHISEPLQVQYYTIPFEGKYRTDLDEKQWVDLLEKQLTLSVERQLLSDAPLAFFLSGGLDSSLLLAIARKLHPDKPIKAFTIDTANLFKEEGFAEDLPYAKKVAKLLNVDLEIIPADIHIINDFDKMIWHLDEPEADAAPLNVLNIAASARKQGYKVLISGTGGDDVFSGYRRHLALQLERQIEAVPLFLRKGIRYTARALPNNVKGRRARKLVEHFDRSSIDRRIGYFFWIQPEQLRKLFHKDLQPVIGQIDPYDFFEDLLAEIPHETNALNQMLFWELRSFLPDHNLNYTDKLSMAASIETRVPFLDKDLVALSTQIPPELKLKGREAKYILKKLAERYLPKEVIYRPKTGFVAPIRKWIQGEMKSMIHQRLLSPEFNKWGIFDQAEIKKLIAENDAGKADYAYTIWSLLAIESWLRQFAR